MFSRLDHLLGGWGDRHILDLYAGSGALGLEALSRGAASATLVERDRAALAAIRRNVASLGAQASAQVVPAAVSALIGRGSPSAFDVVFADPPYDSADRIPTLLGSLITGGWVGADAVVVVETGRRAEVVWPAGLTAEQDRAYGDTRVWYGRRHTTPPGSDKD